MKTLGSKSIASVLQKIIRVVWYLEFLLLLSPALLFIEGSARVRYSWPVTLTAAETAPRISATNPNITGFRLHPEDAAEANRQEQVLTFQDDTLGRKLLQTLHNLVSIAVIMLVTWLLLKIFTDLAQNRPFSLENAGRIRWIAIAVLFRELFDFVEAFLNRLYTAATINIAGAKLHWYNYSFNGETFLLGILLFIIAEIFRRGAEYQADSESIL